MSRMSLAALSAGGFQDRAVGLNLIRPPRIYQYKSGCAAITVIEVTVGPFPSPRHLSAKFASANNLHWLANQSAAHAQARVFGNADQTCRNKYLTQILSCLQPDTSHRFEARLQEEAGFR